ncbi:rhodanese-like domain-containing protein [Maribacter arenosus]|uniref:Rhodanese-like domain-containing protein n=1 Tax=Maribacter arenosus TaxID=1854708 RepID=A0ABR7V778_9FLAO|nr:rhodanese-like domain-containing protein [Maribacter arenosus]MBD0849530.1 rhodanese-like domain-containing protein [Maribacter arenosus]
MKRLSIFLVAILISSVALLSSFTNNDLNRSSIDPPNEFETLLNYFETNNNFINSPSSPALVMADEVKKNMKDPKYHIIDIRTDSWFEYSHIKDANNVQPEDLLTYFETKISPADFDKIVLICYSGQSAAYFTSLLRLAGYDNVYSMKWGMGCWRLDFAEDTWLKNTSDAFADKLETNENAKPDKGSYPSLNTGKTEAQEILRARLEKAFATPYNEYIIKSEDIFANPSDYFVLDYWGQEKYQNGHIPGAVFYEPNGSLASTTDLSTLPIDKKVAVFSATGQEAAYVVAYLNLLGYDVGNVAYGANAFMNKILKEKNWDAFTKKEINMFPVIE